MKRILSAILALSLCLSLLAACSGGKAPAPSTSPEPSETVSGAPTEQPSEQPSEEPSEQPTEQPSEEPSEQPSEEPAAPVFTLSSHDFTLFSAGSSWTLKYTADPVLDEAPVYTSSDESVATVDEKGKVTAVAPGQAVITAAYGELTDTCIVRCRWENAPESVDLAAFYATLFTDPENTPAVMDMTEMPEAMEAYYSGLSDIETKQCIIYMPMITAVAFEIALIEVANASDVKTVKAILQARIDNEINNNFNYPFVTANWTNNSRIVSNGNYIMMVAHKDCDSFVDSFNALF